MVDICWFSVVCWLLWMVCECGCRELDERSELWLYGAICDRKARSGLASQGTLECGALREGSKEQAGALWMLI